MSVNVSNKAIKNHSVIVAVGVVALGGAAFLIWKFWDKIKNPNKGTPFEGTGVVGTVAHATDAALGGAPSAIGGAIGRALFDWIHPTDDAENIFYKFTIEGAPVYSTVLKANTNTGSIRSDLIDGKGYFTYYGERFRMRQDSAGNRIAVRS